MKFAIEYLKPAITFLEYGFKFFDYNILHDGPVFNILQRAFKTTEDY
jgi:hypothetical protein